MFLNRSIDFNFILDFLYIYGLDMGIFGETLICIERWFGSLSYIYDRGRDGEGPSN